MAVTQFTVSGQQNLSDLLDANAGNIVGTSFDAVSNVLTVNLQNGDSLAITVTTSPADSTSQSLAEWYQSSGWPKKVVKDGVVTETFSPLEVAQARQIDQRMNGGRFKTHRIVPSEDRACEGGSCCGRR